MCTNIQRGYSLLELLMVVAVLGIVASLAIPNFLSSRRVANEASAISSIRTIVAAQYTYANTAGNGVFADDLAKLGSTNILDSTLGGSASPSKSGYSFGITDSVAATASTPGRFCVSATVATPTGVTATGTRRFGATEAGVVKYSTTSISSPYDMNTINNPAQALPLN